MSNASFSTTRSTVLWMIGYSATLILSQQGPANALSLIHPKASPILFSRRRQAQKLNVVLAAVSEAPEGTNLTPQKKPSRAYGHLYRHFEDISIDCWLRCAEPAEFLYSCGFTTQDIDCIEKEIPNLAKISVHDHLAPKIRFLIQTLGGGEGKFEWATDDSPGIPDEGEEECEVQENESNSRLKLQVSDLAKAAVPYALFLQVLLDRTVGPRHAYLQHARLPHGRELLRNNGRELREFLQVCHNRKSSAAEFLNLCIRWGARNVRPMGGSVTTLENVHTLERLSHFEQAFRDGLIVTAQNTHTPALDAIQCSPGNFIELLLSNGANYREPDPDHNLALHWAAKSGNLQATKALTRAHVENGDQTAAEVILYTQAGNDGATPLHWAAYGGGGEGQLGQQCDVCRFFLDAAGDSQSKELTNAVTWSGNTPLLWAAWAGDLEIVKLLVEYGADPHASNNKGCNAAHFAAAGGHLDVCKYLFNELKVDFFRPNESGSSPLQHAMTQDHRAVVDWMTTKVFDSEHDTSPIHLEGDEFGAAAVLESLGLPSFPVSEDSVLL